MIQRAVTRVAGQLVGQGVGWETIVSRLSQLPWRLDSTPWVAVCGTPEDGKVKMKTNRGYVSLLDSLLRVHLAPNSKQDIIRAKKEYKRLWEKQYPVTDDKLAAHLITQEDAEAKSV